MEEEKIRIEKFIGGEKKISVTLTRKEAIDKIVNGLILATSTTKPTRTRKVAEVTLDNMFEEQKELV